VIADLKPYPATKDSGVPWPWLGQVPVGWEVRRNGRLFAQRNETGFPDLPILEVSLRTGVRVRDFDASSRKQVMADRAKYKRAADGDVAYNMMRMWQGAVGVVPIDGLISPAYVVARPFPGTVPGYFEYLYRTDSYMGEVDNYSRGIVKDRNRLYWEQFKQIPTPYPPPGEQAAIVQFLDYADRRIRRYIRAKQKLIKLLEEQVTAKASEAMCNRACGSERLETIAIQYLRPVARSSAHVYTPLGLYNRGRGLFHKGQSPGSELGESTFFWVEPGDLVISGQFAWEGAIALASTAEQDAIVSHRYYLLRGIEGRSTTPYLLALLRSDFGAMLLDQHSRGAAGRNRPLNLHSLLKERVPVPPYEEQLALDEFIRSIVPIRVHIQSDIFLLREYRTRLIADVVTGKLDVREVAARLPDEVEDPEPLDEVDALTDAQDAPDDDLEAAPDEADA
jgi:type I restriction enzyme S subunit